MKETVDARKTRIGRKEALELAASADELYASRGSKVVHIDLRKDKPAPDDVAALLIGPSGNLRAPTFRAGRTLVVGFDEASYKRVLS